MRKTKSTLLLALRCGTKWKRSKEDHHLTEVEKISQNMGSHDPE